MVSFRFTRLSFGCLAATVGLSGSPAFAGQAAVTGCSLLFTPHIGRSKVEFDVEGNEIDARGNRILKPGETAFATKRSAPFQLVASESHTIYDVKQIQHLLDNEKNLAEAVKSEYEKMVAAGGSRLIVKLAGLEKLEPLYRLMPNFTATLDRVKRAMMVSIMAEQPVVLPPIILLGPPGVGKTFFAATLADAIGTGYGFIPMNSVTAGWILSGAHPTWKGAVMGKVARILIDGKFANPVIVADEIDKAGSKEYDVLAPFYQLWESTATTFTDEFLQLQIDASLINWIATANYKQQIPEPILKRAIVIDVPTPDEAQLRFIVDNVLRLYLERHPKLKFSPVISNEVFATFRKKTPRDIRLLIEDAVGGALLANRTELQAVDIDTAVLHEQEKRSIGFELN